MTHNLSLQNQVGSNIAYQYYEPIVIYHA